MLQRDWQGSGQACVCWDTGGATPQPVYVHAQRWGGGFKSKLVRERCLVDEALALAACGDFCIESSAQGALLSGLAAADAMRVLMMKRSQMRGCGSHELQTIDP